METTTPSYRSLIGDNLLSLLGAGCLLFFDVIGEGSYLVSVFFCPIWFIVSLIRNAIIGSERRVTLFRIAIPALTLAIAFVSTSVQWKIADANGERVVAACEAFHSENGRYPNTLNELVPRYLPSVPPAKYCLNGNFNYYNSDEHSPILWWNKFGFYRKVYSFDTKEWGGVD